MLFRLIRLVKNHNMMGKSPTREGQRVVLISTGGGFPPSNNFPLEGSNFECEGTMRSISGPDGHVNWDNGRSHSYPLTRLKVCDLPFTPIPVNFKTNFEADNPNLTWKKVKAELYGQHGHHEIEQPQEYHPAYETAPSQRLYIGRTRSASSW